MFTFVIGNWVSNQSIGVNCFRLQQKERTFSITECEKQNTVKF